ncbi:hypothetical protein Tco_0573935 [Tanacetum coccineum]
MMLEDYLKYESEKESRLWMSVQSQGSPTRYEWGDVDCFHLDKSRTFDYSYYYEDIKIEKYYELLPLHPCFQPPQQYTKDGLVSLDGSNEVDIDSMTIVEYELYMAKQGPRKNRLNDHTYGFTSNFYDQSPCTPDPQAKDKELSLKEIFNDLFKVGAKNLKGMKQEEDQLLEEFRDELLVTTMVDKEADCNPTREVKELERLLAKDPQSYFTEIKVATAKGRWIDIALAHD